MAVNVENDSVDPNSAWANCAPLIWEDLLVGTLDDDGGLQLPHGGGAARFYFEIFFQRAKGQYFSNLQFGTCVTPDSDEMVRLGTVALCRLLLRTAAPKAVYAKLSREEVVALRRKVDDPAGFAGLELADTKYESWADLVAACCDSRWVLDDAAEDRVMFPMIDKATGNFLLGSRMTYGGEALGKRLNEIGVSLGFQKGVIGAWSLRKDACEVQATCGSADATFLAARVLGHRKVNSRTMDRVYRADLRLRDLGQHWRGAEKPAQLLCALSSPSAKRVPAAGAAAAMHFSELPADAPEREAVEARAAVIHARREEAAAEQKALEAVRATAPPLEAEVDGADGPDGDHEEGDSAEKLAERAVRAANERLKNARVRAARALGRVRRGEGRPKLSKAVLALVAGDPDVVREAAAVEEAKRCREQVKLQKATSLGVGRSRVRQAARAVEGGEEAMQALAAAVATRQSAVAYGQHVAVGDYSSRVWLEGQDALRTVPGLREERCATHRWPVMTEEEAITFGLDRRDRTRVWRVLKLLLMEGGRYGVY